MGKAIQLLTVGATNLIELVGLQDVTNDEYPVDASVAAVLTDLAGGVVVGGESIPMAYVAGTSGAGTIYRGELPATAALVVGQRYVGTISVTDVSLNKRSFVVHYLAVEG